MKLDQARKDIREALERAKDPVLACSFGKDSMLLLYLIREVQPISCLVFQDWWQDLTFVKKMIQEWSLTCFFYNPLQWDVRRDSIVTWYNIQNKPLPIVTDLVKSDKCGKDWSKKIQSYPQPSYIWDVTFAGSKASDTHQLVNQLDFSSFDICTPLWDWTDKEVFDAIDILGIPIDERVYKLKDNTKDLGNTALCMNCLSNEVVWCPKDGQMIQGIRG